KSGNLTTFDAIRRASGGSGGLSQLGAWHTLINELSLFGSTPFHAALMPHLVRDPGRNHPPIIGNTPPDRGFPPPTDAPGAFTSELAGCWHDFHGVTSAIRWSNGTSRESASVVRIEIVMPPSSRVRWHQVSSPDLGSPPVPTRRGLPFLHACRIPL